MNRMSNNLPIFALFLFVVVPQALAQQVGGLIPVVDPVGKPPVAGVVTRATPRTVNMSELFGDDNRVVTAALEVDKLLREDSQQTELGALRMGVVQGLEAGDQRKGHWTQLDDKGWIWTMVIEATGAKAIRLRIPHWHPPGQAELIVYDPQHPEYARGPLNFLYSPASDMLWTPTVYADEVYLEYYLPPGVDHADPQAQITVDALLNQYRTGDEGPLDGGELPCHLDVTCFPDWHFVARGVAELSFVGDRFGFFCSGSMFNRDPTDFTPLFLTARHCGVDSGNAGSLLATWFYQSRTCDGDPPDLRSLPQTQGIVLLVDDADTDYTMVGMSTANTQGVTFEGWDPNHWGDNLASAGIHHPRGTKKRITFGTKTADVRSCVDGQSWLISNPNNNGDVEPGSSGSPIFDSAQLVRGTLSCGNWGCDEDNSASYGRFDVAWPKLQPFLRPTDPMFVDREFGGTEKGTSAEPFNTVLEGIFAVISGSNIHIQAGSYNERFSISKPMTLNSRNGAVTIGR